MTIATEWYSIDDLSLIDSPALLIYPQRVQHNIDTAISMVGDPKRLRPHAKTHKSPEVTRMLLAAGVNSFKCSTIAEAEMLAMEGAQDVLLAYQPVGPKITRLLNLINTFPSTRFSCLTDQPAAMQALQLKAEAQDIQLPVYIDLNIGMNRTGITIEQGAVELFRLIVNAPNLVFAGLHAYDGHISDADLAIRRKRVTAAFAPVKELRVQLEKELGKSIECIAGGMPSFPLLAEDASLVCSPGTFVFFDQSYSDKLADTSFLPAALVLARVISHPGDNRITVDLGHKSIASENPLDKRVYFLNAPELFPVGHSEEHLFFETLNPKQFPIGTVLYGLPYHICPTVALYDSASCVRNGKLEASWKIIARDRQITI